jgi:hypothetical protein
MADLIVFELHRAVLGSISRSATPVARQIGLLGLNVSDSETIATRSVKTREDISPFEMITLLTQPCIVTTSG